MFKIMDIGTEYEIRNAVTQSRKSNAAIEYLRDLPIILNILTTLVVDYFSIFYQLLYPDTASITGSPVTVHGSKPTHQFSLNFVVTGIG
jgi:hypothetical protein